MLECRDIRKSFGKGRLAQEVLRGVDLRFQPGETCVLLGPSGSGKTTLLSILGCLLTPCSGRLIIHGRHVRHARKAQMIALRRREIGFVFQQAQLLPFLTMEENLGIVGRNVGLPRRQVKSRIEELLTRLNVAHLRNKRPRQASRGEEQRVAVARALVHRPRIILADEPTAALDWENGRAVVRLLTEIAQDEQTILLTVTHDSRLVSMFARRFHIDQGIVSEE